MRLLPPIRRRPMLQLGLAGLVMVGGAYLIALWVVGVVLMAEATFFVVVIWDDGKPKRELSGVERRLDQYRRSG